MGTSTRVFTTVIVGMLAVFALAAAAQSQELSGAALVTALRGGGYTIVMRHASSPREAPDARTANADNTARERQLDEAGRASATAMGEALRRLRIPVGEVFTSPTYRALETVRFAGLRNPTSVNELGDGGRNMQAVGDPQAEWLQKAVTRTAKGNTLVITHMPNIARAFPNAGDVADGESLVFRPDGKGGTALVARVKIEEWPRLR
jgi:phosphohistidine phosphatase SixA